MGKRKAVTMTAAEHEFEFRYRASDATGTVTHGVVRATGRNDAMTALARQGLLIVWMEQNRPPLGRWRTRGRMPLSDAAAGLHALGELLESGLPLSRAMGALPDLTPQCWSAIQPSLLRFISSGYTLAQAFERAPVRLPRIAIGLIAAGEQSGRVAPAVKHAASLLESQQKARAALASALAYPAFLALIGSTTVSLLIVFVFPRMARLLADLGQETPSSTRALIAVGNFVSQWILLLLLAIGLFAAGLGALLSKSRYRRKLHRLLLRMPIVGSIRHSSSTSRICVSMSAMLEGGLPMARALWLMHQVVNDEELKARLQETHERVTTGQSLATAVQETGLVTRTAAMMIAAGERAGSVVSMLQNAGTIEASRAEGKIRIMTRILEPALVFVLGASVMFVAAALLQAVYAITPTVS